MMSKADIKAKAEVWAARHVSGGGKETWQEIADSEGLSFGVIRMSVRHWRRRRGLHEAQHPAPQFATKMPEPPGIDELLDLAERNRAVLDRLDPVVTHGTISLETDHPIGIIFVSCAHLGGRYTLYPEFRQVFEQVLATDRLYWLSLGDDVEGFLPGFRDAGAVVDQALVNPKAQKQLLAHVLDRLAEKNKLLAGCASQHGGEWTRKAVGEDPIKDLYRARGVPYFDGKALLTLQVGGETYRIALAHQFPGTSIYNKNHPQRRALLFDFPNADVAVSGDRHTYSVQEFSDPAWEFDAGIRPSYMRWNVQVGTAKAGPDKYSIRGWSRGVMEWPTLVFWPGRHFISCARDLGLARMMIETG